MYIYETLFILFCVSFSATQKARPNIIFILADDLGWNDVSFHGSSQILTPNIDILAYSGIILNKYYVSPICTPSRSALMTGKYPIHTGMQHHILYGGEPRGLPLGETLLPQYLKELGYSTHMVGKWHLGSYKKVYTPTYRGFDSHLGFWTGHHDYSDHTAMENGVWGLDFRRNMEIAWDLHGQYSTDIFTNEAEKIIKNHNKTAPLFLYFSHAAVHSGNPYNPLPAPDNYVAKFKNITNYQRGRFAGVLTKLDESVGKVVQALQLNGMLENSIIVFSSDNGGPADGFNRNAASNWPLRGVKDTLWEGGVRAAGFLWSPLITQNQRVSSQMVHITDWLPTLYHAAGGDVKKLTKLDGLDLWPSLTNNTDSPREEILHNIDDEFGITAFTSGDWKYLNGSTYRGDWDSWYGPSGRTLDYDVNIILNSTAAKSLSLICEIASKTTIQNLRNQAKVNCTDRIEENDILSPCKPINAPCIFNTKLDPCEIYNLANKYPDMLKELQKRVEALRKTAIPPTNKPLDPKGNPKYWQYTWTNFGDYI
ncbi:hypothetical protein FQR65_LT05333 [Abscondita terminalis]|nr:hypothetical protein FQR65_LT05333 [Abscondita terminalis]